MCKKLHENITEFITKHPTPVKEVTRYGLKELADTICRELSLYSKADHGMVVAAIISLYDRSKLVYVRGILQVPSGETKLRDGRRRKGCDKLTCRGIKVGRAGRGPKVDRAVSVFSLGDDEWDPEALTSEEEAYLVWASQACSVHPAGGWNDFPVDTPPWDEGLLDACFPDERHHPVEVDAEMTA